MSCAALVMVKDCVQQGRTVLPTKEVFDLHTVKGFQVELVEVTLEDRNFLDTVRCELQQEGCDWSPNGSLERVQVDVGSVHRELWKEQQRSKGQSKMKDIERRLKRRTILCRWRSNCCGHCN